MAYDPQLIGQKLRLGLCCINSTLREQKNSVFCSRTCNRKNFTIQLAQEKALKNVADLIPLIEWNQKNNIKCLRISSDLFPHFTDSQTPRYNIDFARPLLKKAGDLAILYGHRIVMHPGQYNQVGAEKQNVFEQTIEDLSHHADILDAMGIDKNGVIIVHGGGVYNSLAKTKERWIKQFNLLPDKVKSRLIIENCERNYSTQDCLDLANACQIPLVFDFHHYNCWTQIYGQKSQKTILEYIPEIIKTWGNRRILMHISEQAVGKRIGAHSDFIEKLPDELFTIIQKYGVDIDLEIEAKMKEKAIMRLYQKYPDIFLNSKTSIKTKIKIPLKNTLY